MSQTITSAEEFAALDNGNRLIGHAPKMNNASIVFGGKNNVLYCEDGVALGNVAIRFNGNNGLVVLGRNKHAYHLDITLYTNCTYVFDREIYFNAALHAIASEECTVALGEGCLVSFGIWIRTADPHLIFDAESQKRINPSRNVIVGDHVWIGQSAMLLKGTTVGSGSIVGAASVVAGKTIGSNSSWAGNPSKRIRGGLFWEGSSVHNWTKKKAAKFKTMDGAPYQFAPDESTLGKGFAIAGSTPAEERLEHYLGIGFDNRAHNRLAVEDAAPAKAPAPVPEHKGLVSSLKRRLGN